ncbi:MAG: glucose-1-phosphate cytidylyltransferase [Planctomycetaceae bacterium]|nr:glucose-1-phosphate cytidylyltransferase [Planctomycetaceae bacterium]
MKVVLLAGGLGTRFAEETSVRPKPMIEIGGVPILLHIMAIYAAQGFREFVIACGYRGDYIKEYFSNFDCKHSDWKINLQSGVSKRLSMSVPDWDIWVVDTGIHSMTGGRIRRLRTILGDEPFLVTYGDGVADVDLSALLDLHRRERRAATLTAVRPPARFGCLQLTGDQIERFEEKPQNSEGWVNGGFFVFEPEVFDYLSGDETVLEREPLERLAADGQLSAYRHEGFWHPMDTLRDKRLLEGLWEGGAAPWKIWSGSNDGGQFFGGPASPGDGCYRIQGTMARRVA